MANGNFWLRRLHSLSGLIPIGVFLCLHLLLNGTVLFGGYARYLSVIEGMRQLPYLIVLELLFIALPLLFHAVWGMIAIFRSENNVSCFSYYHNWAFLVQRITGVLAIFFLIWHVYALRFAGVDGAAVIANLSGALSAPLSAAAYVLGFAAIVYHFCNGLYTFAISWGICRGPRARRVWLAICMIFAVLLFVFGLVVLFHIAALA